jgi:NAD-dependent dihydropyrimidine dehydrogenase PreA subunit
MEYSQSELELSVFKEFPADRNESVCPTRAITWPQDTESPIVDSNACISCGLCVSRCPVKAIFLDDSGAHVNDEPNTHFQVQDYLTTDEITQSTTRLFQDVTETGVYSAKNDAVLSQFLSHFQQVAQDQGVQFPNHLARNLLIACGIGAAMRRRGDTNIRMDMVLGEPGVERGTGEVELGAGVLDAPRNILDNVAVLVARYEVAKDSIVPLIVSLSLPNQRSEYWQVIQDIRNVLGVKINSITIGALIILVWNRANIVITAGDELYIDADIPSLRPMVERILGRQLNAIKEYPGVFESTK